MKSSLLLVVLALSLVSVALGASYTYVEGGSLPGPSTWGTLLGAEVCSSGRFQSPLNIISSFGEYHSSYGGLVLSYTKDSNVQITETGTGVVLTSTGFSDNFLTVSNVLNGTYVLDHIAFHWGQDNSHGSEHQIDFESAAGEIQYYHYNTKYASYSEAVGSGDPKAVAAVGIFLVVGRSSPKNLTALINAMNTTAGPLTTTYAGPLDFTTLYPSASRKYYTYTGSLTSPSCNEVVQWFVLRSYVKITQNDMNRLRKVPLQTDLTAFGKSFNYRPCQVYGTRKVTSNFIPNNGGDDNSASGLVASLVVLLAAIALMF